MPEVLCGCFLRLPDKAVVPCTLTHDHLEQHRCVARGITLLVWSRDDNGSGRVVGGVLADLFADGRYPLPRGGDVV